MHYFRESLVLGGLGDEGFPVIAKCGGMLYGRAGRKRLCGKSGNDFQRKKDTPEYPLT